MENSNINVVENNGHKCVTYYCECGKTIIIEGAIKPGQVIYCECGRSVVYEGK